MASLGKTAADHCADVAQSENTDLHWERTVCAKLKVKAIIYVAAEVRRP
jgi:hypothetical protein